MKASQAIQQAKTLRELAKIANAIHPQIVNTNTCAEFPTFGGEEPADTKGIFSWDEQNLLVQNFEDVDGKDPFVLIPRP